MLHRSEPGSSSSSSEEERSHMAWFSERQRKFSTVSSGSSGLVAKEGRVVRYGERLLCHFVDVRLLRRHLDRWHKNNELSGTKKTKSLKIYYYRLITYVMSP